MRRIRTLRARCERHAAKMREENAGNIRKREAAVRRWKREKSENAKTYPNTSNA